MDMQLAGHGSFLSFQIAFIPGCQNFCLFWEEKSKLGRNCQTLHTTMPSIHLNSSTCAVLPFGRCVYWSANPFKQQNTLYISSGNKVYNRRFLRLANITCSCLVYLHLASLMAAQARLTSPGTFKQASCFSLVPR